VVKAALAKLGDAWPATVSFRELLESAEIRSKSNAEGAENWKPRDIEADRGTLGSALLAFFAKGLCEFQVHPERFVISPGEKPRACSLARLQAARGNDVTNRRHEVLQLGKLERHLVSLLDGKHDRANLIEELTLLAAGGTLNVSFDDQTVTDLAEIRTVMTVALDGALQRLARAAVLIE
jgi:hypothetical protein